MLWDTEAGEISGFEQWKKTRPLVGWRVFQRDDIYVTRILYTYIYIIYRGYFITRWDKDPVLKQAVFHGIDPSCHLRDLRSYLFRTQGLQGNHFWLPKRKGSTNVFFVLLGELFVIGTVQDVTSYKLSNTMSKGKRYRLRHWNLVWRLH